MTPEEKELLLKDLCARLPYGIIMRNRECENDFELDERTELTLTQSIKYSIEKFRAIPYLRPMSSMTEEEKKEVLNIIMDDAASLFYIDDKGIIDGKTTDFMKEGLNGVLFCPRNIELYLDWLLSRHFDYRGLIEKNLAIEAPEGMYNEHE